MEKVSEGIIDFLNRIGFNSTLERVTARSRELFVKIFLGAGPGILTLGIEAGGVSASFPQEKRRTS